MDADSNVTSESAATGALSAALTATAAPATTTGAPTTATARSPSLVGFLLNEGPSLRIALLNRLKGKYRKIGRW